jgi:hypothetical protein
VSAHESLVTPLKRLTTALVVVVVASVLALGVPLGVMVASRGLVPTTAATSAKAAALPAAANSGLRREVLGFVNDYQLGDPSVGYPSWHFSLLTTVVYFALHVNSGDGALVKTDTGWNIFHSATMTRFVQTAHASGTRVIVSLNLHANLCDGLNPVNAGHTIGEIVGQMTGTGIDGINIDYEGGLTQCTPTDTTRSLLVSFTKNLKAAMPGGSYLVIDTYAGSAEDNLEFFDIAGLEPNVDAFFVMSYDSDYSNSTEAPLNCTSYCFNPVSPLNTYRFNVTKSMSEYKAYMRPSKIILGQALYGRRGCVGNLTDAHQYPIPGTNFVSTTYLYASTVRSQSGVSNFASHRDPLEGVAEWDTWYDSDWKCNREQYFDDSVSLSYKYDLVNTDDLRGVGFFTLDYGGGAPELWNALATHFTLIPGLVGNLGACASNTSVSLSWTAAPTSDGPVTSYQVTASPGGASTTVPGNATFATVSGLTPGTAYTITVVGINSSGAGVGATADVVTPGAAPLFTSYLNWYDKASSGMLSDNIHLVNSGASASSGCVTVTGQVVASWSLISGQETYVAFPAGTIGGPVVVTVNTGQAVLASQRVQYNSSFNEVWAASAAQATTTGFFNWYDKASPGMLNDNIHLLNPGTSSANVTVSLPGASPQNVILAAGAESFVNFPGQIGGPVTVTSSQPVLASQRVQHNASFNEIWASSAAKAATTSYFNWYDKATPGMVNDNIHLLNPGAMSATVTVSLLGASPQTVAVGAGAEAYVNFAGKIGGPVMVSSTQPVLASQRVQYFQTFNEAWSASATQAAATSYFNWYDKASPGMFNDNIHLLNPGTASATVTVRVSGASPQMVTVGAGAEVYVNFPGTIGGPVLVSASQPVLASQRVQYYESFNEMWAGA